MQVDTNAFRDKEIPVARVMHPPHGANNAYRQLDSASAWIKKHNNGTYEAYIEHAAIPGVTPEMMIWFFKHLDCFTCYNPYTGTFDGPEIPVYRLWHCRDHVAITQVGPGADKKDKDCAIAFGSTFIIHEVILQKYPVHAISRVYDLYYDAADGTRIGKGTFANGRNGHTNNVGNFGFWLLGPMGIRGGFIDHYFQAIDPETLGFQTRFVLGSNNVRLLNHVLRLFTPNHATPEQFLKDWILHNIEESGETAKLLPALYANPDKVFRRSTLVQRVVE